MHAVVHTCDTLHTALNFLVFSTCLVLFLLFLSQYAIYLAYKVGPNPRFKRMVMLSCTMEDEKFLTSYINAFTAVFRAAPASVAKTVGGPSGIFLMVDGNPVHTTEKSQSRRASQSHRESPKTRHDGDSSRISSPGGGDAGSDGEYTNGVLHL